MIFKFKYDQAVYCGTVLDGKYPVTKISATRISIIKVSGQLTHRPRFFKRWIALFTEQITIQRINIEKIHCVISWIVIYPVGSAIHVLNNWVQNRNEKRCFSPFPHFPRVNIKGG